jgi:hypothetical protein
MSKHLTVTDPAEKLLSSIQLEVREQVLDVIVERKSIPGDSEIEITASDIEEVRRSMRVRFADTRLNRLLYRDIIIRVYTVLGLTTLLAGIFYPYVRILLDNPVQLALVFAGVAMLAAATLMKLYLRRRLQRERELMILQEHADMMRYSRAFYDWPEREITSEDVHETRWTNVPSGRVTRASTRIK